MSFSVHTFHSKKKNNGNALFKFRDGSVKTVKLLGNLQLNGKKKQGNEL